MIQPFETPPISADELQQLIAVHLRQSDARVARLDYRGQPVWVKQPEHLGLRLLRLQKGNPNASFERERAALHTLHDAGMPVPAMLAEGADYLAIAGAGTSLAQILREQSGSLTERCQIFAKAARALALLHTNHFSHGRPSLKDICWDGEQITFIDFERFADKRNTASGHSKDVVMFLLNAYSIALARTPEIDAAIAAYRDHDPGEIWDGAAAWCWRMRWVDWLTRPIQKKRNGAREFKAIPLLLNSFKED